MERDRKPSGANEEGAFGRREYLGMCGLTLGALSVGVATEAFDDGGEPVQTLTIVGSEDSLSTYEVTVSDHITPVEAQGALSTTGSVGRSAEDALSGGARRYQFTGEITNFDVNGDVAVFVNGDEAAPANLVR